MKILAIRRLVEKYTINELHQLEMEIIQEKPLSISMEGKDQAQNLATVIAAVWILTEMKNKGIEFKDAFCEYAKRVRD